MTYDLSAHPYFQEWTDPATGAMSYLLHERIAPLQKSPYYITPAISADGKWLWFYAAWPPSRKWYLSAVSLDPKAPEMVRIPGAEVHGNPLVLPEGDAVYLPVDESIYRVNLEGNFQEIVRLPKDLIGSRYFGRLMTGVTLSADGKHFVMDSRIGNRWLISLAEVDTGEVTPLRWFFRNHHHAYFSPTDPKMILIGQGPWNDIVTGDKGSMNIRMWLMDTELTYYEPLFGDLWFGQNCISCHEWWTASGKICWCDYKEGIYETDPAVSPRKRERIWTTPLCHAQSDPTERFYVGDQNPYHRTGDRPCRVFFFDRQTGKEVAIVSEMALPELDPRLWRPYHLDPHACFSPDGEFITYCTTVRSSVDVAVAPVAQLRSLLDG